MTHTLHELNTKGDFKLMWDPANATEVAAARKTFDDLKAKGHYAYAVEGENGERGELLREFDPKIRRIIMAPRSQGG